MKTGLTSTVCVPRLDHSSHSVHGRWFYPLNHLSSHSVGILIFKALLSFWRNEWIKAHFGGGTYVTNWPLLESKLLRQCVLTPYRKAKALQPVL